MCKGRASRDPSRGGAGIASRGKGLAEQDLQRLTIENFILLDDAEDEKSSWDTLAALKIVKSAQEPTRYLHW